MPTYMDHRGKTLNKNIIQERNSTVVNTLLIMAQENKKKGRLL